MNGLFDLQHANEEIARLRALIAVKDAALKGALRYLTPPASVYPSSTFFFPGVLAAIREALKAK